MDVNKNAMYTPHLKKVLKSYQVVATNSLHGPNSVMAAWAADEKLPEVATVKEKGTCTKKPGKDYDHFVAPPPFPIQQPPIFTPPDQTRCERSETILEGETISCFVVGGEKRLCLPQILNTVLRDFSLQQINCVCDELHIFCSRCNTEQLDVLKVTAILPMAAPSCGLITKTDAERLCSALLHSSPPRMDPYLAEKRTFHFDVYHECFGKCSGIYTPDWYASPFARCIECRECRGLFTPQKFVCHAHGATENRTCHWGFDSANWRAYVLLVADQDKPEEELKKHLNEMKVRFDYTQKYKRKQVSSEEWDTSKKIRSEEKHPCSYAGTPLDAALAYWYASPWSRVSAFKPWSPAIGKDGKPIFVPHTIPHYFADSIPTSVPVYLAHPVLPTESESKSVNASASTPSKVIKKSEPKEECFSPAFDSDDTLSETSVSTLSGMEDGVTKEEVQQHMRKELRLLDKWLHQENLEDPLREKIISKVTAIINKCHFVAELQQKNIADDDEAKGPSRIHVQDTTPTLAQLQKDFTSQLEVAKLREQALLEEVQTYRLAAKLADQLDVPKLSEKRLCVGSKTINHSTDFTSALKVTEKVKLC